MFGIDGFGNTTPHAGAHRNGIDEADPPQTLCGILQTDRHPYTTARIVCQLHIERISVAAAGVLRKLGALSVHSHTDTQKKDEASKKTTEGSECACGDWWYKQSFQIGRAHV